MRQLHKIVTITLIAALAAALGFSQFASATPQAGDSKKTATSDAESQSTKGAAADSDAPQVTAEKPTSFWMEKKLDYSKSLLEALTTGDFQALEADAKKMSRLAKIEGFVRRKNPDYRAQLTMFQSATQELIRQAKRHNAEGAGLAFNQLTNSCVACHVLLREGID